MVESKLTQPLDDKLVLFFLHITMKAKNTERWPKKSPNIWTLNETLLSTTWVKIKRWEKFKYILTKIK